MTILDKSTIEKAFDALGAKLSQRGKLGEIAVYGGAAMMLHFEIDRTTQDVDAVIETEHGPVQQAAREIARENGWPESWLNEGVSVYLSSHARGDDLALLRDYPRHGRVGLRVYLANPKYLLALKLAALRVGPDQRDIDDAMRLAQAVGITTADELIEVHKSYFPTHPLDARRTLIISEMAERLDASSS